MFVHRGGVGVLSQGFVQKMSLALAERVVGVFVRATKFAELSSSSREHDFVCRRRMGEGCVV